MSGGYRFPSEGKADMAHLSQLLSRVRPPCFPRIWGLLILVSRRSSRDERDPRSYGIDSRGVRRTSRLFAAPVGDVTSLR